ncbi:hypothetical protein RISK_004757 [Rhodopirellula islandica]|uniref:Uncharacterized protein n=1 Tax=Rhodopirellula islandica TaxID=595434 RepID=A0A0J1B9M5_RHOIS|nr:hypothetical protein RISK_004757 [Rhodopirellula islandica]
MERPIACHLPMKKRQGGRMSSLAASGFNKTSKFFERPEFQSNTLFAASPRSS